MKEFQKIPGVGPSIAEDLWSLGFRSLNELKGQDPEAMYESLCSLRGVRVDRCMLYVFRCAVYFITEETHDPELLKWWRWKDTV
ncbi:helix-hairpin-helix domain-containing protein [Gemmatimonadota bacterium]